MTEEIFRIERCGCKSFLLGGRSGLLPNDEGMWVMEASCPIHVALFEDFNRKIDRHIEEDHGIEGDMSNCDKCGYRYSIEDLYYVVPGKYWCALCIQGVDSVDSPM